jgi:hypothetical protein
MLITTTNTNIHGLVISNSNPARFTTISIQYARPTGISELSPVGLSPFFRSFGGCLTNTRTWEDAETCYDMIQLQLRGLLLATDLYPPVFKIGLR